MFIVVRLAFLGKAKLPKEIRAHRQV